MSIKEIKSDFKRTVDNLPIDQKADLYFESRKKSLKHLNHGEIEKSYKEILKGDRLYSDNSALDTDRLFHKAHHRYLEYDCTYNHFKLFRFLLMTQNEKTHGYVNLLIEIKNIREFLKENTSNPEDVINYLNQRYEQFYDEMKESVELAASMQIDMENNENFKEHNLFKDIDPIGYTVEDLYPDRYNQIAYKIADKINNVKQSKIDKLEQSIKALRD